MTNKTNEQMMEEWVQAGIDGGWKLIYDEVTFIGVSYERHTNNLFAEFNAVQDGHNTPQFSRSIPDLIADGGFMKAVYGDDKNNACQLKSLICENCPMPKQHGIDFKHCGFINYIYHSMLAVRLLVTGGNAVKYLWENMKKETL